MANANLSPESHRANVSVNFVKTMNEKCCLAHQIKRFIEQNSYCSNDALKNSGINMNRTPQEMENHVFQKARTKEEYLALVGKVILHVRTAGMIHICLI